LAEFDDLASYFAGSWEVRRRIADYGHQRFGWLTGSANFVPISGRLRYHEEGVLVFGEYRVRASQSLWFLPSGSGSEVRFPDERLFYVFELSSGLADVFHQCGSDAYRGRYRIKRRDHWTLVWQVHGPSKRASIRTCYFKAKRRVENG
jgi:Family of unknown function (DUF6314)